MAHMVLNKVKKQVKTGNIQFLALLLFCCSGLVCFGQKTIVALSADTKNAEVDETVVFRVSTNVEGPISIDFPAEFEVDYGVMHQISQEMSSSGKLKTYYITQNTGSFNKPGTYTFKATVLFKNVAYSSNKITITVEENKGSNISIKSSEPVFGYIEAKKMSVYEGEPVLLNSKIISRYDIINVEGYQAFKADKNSEEHPFNYTREYVEETKLNGKTVQTFEYGKQLLIPIATGKCRIKPFEMALRCHSSIFDRTFTFKSTGLTLNVKPLPKGAPSNFIGAVGEYELKQELSDIDKLKVGDVFQLKLTVSGIGNLHNITEPKIQIPQGCKIYGDPERIEEYEFTEGGVSGYITFVYNIQMLEEGEFDFDAPGISYFDPRKEKYISIHSTPFTILLGAKNTTVIAKHQPKDSNSKPVEIKSVSTSAVTKAANGSNLSLYLGIGIPTITCAFFLLFLFARKKRSKDEHIIALAKEEKELHQLEAQTTDFWTEVLNHSSDSNQVSVLLPKAIIQQLETKYGLNNTSRERVLLELGDRDPQNEKEIRDIISQCDHYRYGFGADELPTEQLISRVKDILKL